ncbi:Protein of unknown function [Lentzea albidocapillata subsp. violacea]|uniref:DUF4232 domain-containing protein n=1 Tax=Lentzea albidocapillata subsp. violacea TaxID=128104 RepID=A0A1G9GU40_9PSEU|nr:DUF4232 domain-containing protein [Lentzea albidocapillata]SDL04124.1 Protein of unknown function [Lentzea albidocapillata subsp. violacea]
MTRRLIACGLLVLASVTACGTRTPDNASQTLPTAPSTPSSTASSAPASDDPQAASRDGERCDAATLKGEVVPTDAGAGNRYGKFVVTNSGTAPCTLNGYSGFQLENASGAVPTKLERKADPGPTALTLAPGGKATANLHWNVVPAGSEPVQGTCQPEPTKVSAIPPNETAPLSVPWTFGSVCSGGRIEISAFYAS